MGGTFGRGGGELAHSNDYVPAVCTRLLAI